MEACGRKRDVELAPASTSHTRPLCIEQANHSPVSHARRLRPQPQDNAQTRRSTETSFRYGQRAVSGATFSRNLTALHAHMPKLCHLELPTHEPCVVRRLSVASLPVSLITGDTDPIATAENIRAPGEPACCARDRPPLRTPPLCDTPLNHATCASALLKIATPRTGYITARRKANAICIATSFGIAHPHSPLACANAKRSDAGFRRTTHLVLHRSCRREVVQSKEASAVQDTCVSERSWRATVTGK